MKGKSLKRGFPIGRNIPDAPENCKSGGPGQQKSQVDPASREWFDTGMADDDTPPITLTPKAAAMIKEIWAEEVKEPDVTALRLGVRGGGCAGFLNDISFTTVEPTDVEFYIDGIRIVIDPVSLQFLVGMELDYLDGLKGSGFKFNNPNSTGSCGCGKSFTA